MLQALLQSAVARDLPIRITGRGLPPSADPRVANLCDGQVGLDDPDAHCGDLNPREPTTDNERGCSNTGGPSAGWLWLTLIALFRRPRLEGRG